MIIVFEYEKGSNNKNKKFLNNEDLKKGRANGTENT
jgi:hypothetical protein